MTNRTRISLDGIWDFQIDPENVVAPGAPGTDGTDAGPPQAPFTAWRQIQVPMPWQAQFDDLRYYSGAAWYRRTLDVNATRLTTPNSCAILHFGAADYHATVWINGRRVGEHEGGYLPFAFDVTAYLVAGANELMVRVVDADDDESRWPDYPFREVPHGKQSWYGPIGGLWQSVWLEFRHVAHIGTLRLTPDAETGSIAVEAELSPACDDRVQLQATVTTQDGDHVADAVWTGSQGAVQVAPNQIERWSPDNPHLYVVTVTLSVEGRMVDESAATCGFRTVAARAGRIYLNDEPIYLRGVLDQAYYPETIYTPPSLAFLEDQVRKAKALGLNCLRTHIKIEDPRYYEVADRLGILIWTEIPNWVLLTPAADQRIKQTFRGMVARDWNHPSIIAWSLVNENWGTDLARDAEHRRWLADFYAEARRLDPTRLIVDNSPCPPSFHVASDIDDYHHYRAIPDHAAAWDEWVAEVAARSDWMWAEDYRENRRADLPLIVSEFGNWGLPNPDAIQEQGRDPWWFETGHERGDGIVYPHGMRQRFQFWNLGAVFGSFEDFISQHQRHMARSLEYEIGSMRLRSELAGYVITEFTDVHWECNGLLDMQRNVKAHLGAFTALNQDRVVVVRPHQWAGRGRDRIEVTISAVDVDGAGMEGVLHWVAGAQQGVVDAPGGVIQLSLPDHPSAGLLPVQAHWRDARGQTVAVGEAEVAWTTPRQIERAFQVVDDPALAETLIDLGITIADRPDAIFVARRYTEDLQRMVRAGACLLLLAAPGDRSATSGTEVALPMGNVVARAGTDWQGDWATAFSWIKKSGPFATLPGDPLLEMEYADIMPNAVISGLPPWAMRSRSWAGLALGWIHKPVSLLAQISYGAGEMVVTTFDLRAQTLAEQALAQTLFAGMAALLPWESRAQIGDRPVPPT